MREVTSERGLRPREVYIARGDADLLVAVRPRGLVAIMAPEDPEFRWHPSVDRLMDSVLAHVKPAQIVGVLMTGMGNDGAAAMARLRASGGRTIAEAEIDGGCLGHAGRTGPRRRRGMDRTA